MTALVGWTLLAELRRRVQVAREVTIALDRAVVLRGEIEDYADHLADLGPRHDADVASHPPGPVR